MTVASWPSSAYFWEGYVFLYNPFTAKVSCWPMFSLFSTRYSSAELLALSCADEWHYSVTSAGIWISPHGTSWRPCWPTSLAWPGPSEGRLCSPEFPHCCSLSLCHLQMTAQMQRQCNSSSSPFNCIIQACATALFCNIIWTNLFFTISC